MLHLLLLCPALTTTSLGLAVCSGTASEGAQQGACFHESRTSTVVDLHRKAIPPTRPSVSDVSGPVELSSCLARPRLSFSWTPHASG